MPFKTQEQVDRIRLPEDKTEHWEFDERCNVLTPRLNAA
jgi:hypothetical protein